MILAFVMFAQNSTMTQQLDGEVADPKLITTTAVDTFSADFELVKNELQSHPGVLSVSQVDLTPWSISSSPINLSRSADLNESTVVIGNRNIGYDYADTMDVSFLAGRNYSRDRANDRFPSLRNINANGGPYSILLDDRAAQALGFENAQASVGQSIYRHLEPPSVDREMAIELVVIGAIDKLKYQFVDFGVFGITGDALTLAPEFANLMVIKILKGK